MPVGVHRAVYPPPENAVVVNHRDDCNMLDRYVAVAAYVVVVAAVAAVVDAVDRAVINEVLVEVAWQGVVAPLLWPLYDDWALNYDMV